MESHESVFISNLYQDESCERGQGHQEGGRREEKGLNRAEVSRLLQGEHLLASDVADLVGERRLPRVQLQNLDAVENLVHESGKKMKIRIQISKYNNWNWITFVFA